MSWWKICRMSAVTASRRAWENAQTVRALSGGADGSLRVRRSDEAPTAVYRLPFAVYRFLWSVTDNRKSKIENRKPLTAVAV